jgi:hypothetical protein
MPYNPYEGAAQLNSIYPDCRGVGNGCKLQSNRVPLNFIEDFQFSPIPTCAEVLAGILIYLPSVGNANLTPPPG